jgi:hypothetical protein
LAGKHKSLAEKAE